MMMLPGIEFGVIYAITGGITGLAAGLFGIGGGMFVVPALLYLFHATHTVPIALEMPFAAGTSLAIMIVTSAMAVRAHVSQSNILWHIYRRLWLGIIFGTIAGSLLAPELPTSVLKVLLALILLVVLINMLQNIQTVHQEKLPGPWVGRLVGAGTGLLAGLVGVGGGVLLIPYLTFCGVDTRKISAVCSVCTFSVALVGTMMFMIPSLDNASFPAYTTGYIYWPAVLWLTIPSMLMAPVGARLTYVLPRHQLRYAFAGIMALMVISLLF